MFGERRTEVTDESQLEPALTTYLALIDGFIAGRISGTEFQTAYLTALTNEQHFFGDAVFAVLQRLFSDADDYVENPELRTEPEDVDDDQLRDCARQARELLRNLGFR